VVKKLEIHCPEVAPLFSADSCIYNMTAADLQVVAKDCQGLQTGFFSNSLGG
jgi:hypothetical protein